MYQPQTQTIPSPEAGREATTESTVSKTSDDTMARMYLTRTLSGFAPSDEPSAEIWRKYQQGEVYRADVVKPRNYKHHKLALALLNLTYDNLPEKYAKSYASFDQFRYAVAEDAGHVESYVSLQGEIKTMPKSISYDAIPDDIDFGKVMAAMMTVCARILDVAEPMLAIEVSRYADSHYGAAA